MDSPPPQQLWYCELGWDLWTHRGSFAIVVLNLNQTAFAKISDCIKCFHSTTFDFEQHWAGLETASMSTEQDFGGPPAAALLLWRTLPRPPPLIKTSPALPRFRAARHCCIKPKTMEPTMGETDSAENSSSNENCTLWGVSCVQVGSVHPSTPFPLSKLPLKGQIYSCQLLTTV